MTATAPRPVAELLVSTGRETIEGVTIVVTACCSQELSHVVDGAPPGEPTFDLTAFWNTDGDQVTKCRCGLDLPGEGVAAMMDGRATEKETRRLRALEDAVTAFAAAVGSHEPPLIGFYPPGPRAERSEEDVPRDSLREIYRLAVEAAGMLARAHGVGTSAVARRLRQWCEANRERCK